MKCVTAKFYSLIVANLEGVQNWVLSTHITKSQTK